MYSPRWLLASFVETLTHVIESHCWSSRDLTVSYVLCNHLSSLQWMQAWHTLFAVIVSIVKVTTTCSSPPTTLDIFPQSFINFWFCFKRQRNWCDFLVLVVTYVPCNDCKHCGNHNDLPFNPSHSPTSNWLSCGDQQCKQLDTYYCDNEGVQGQCAYRISYAEQSTSEGRLVRVRGTQRFQVVCCLSWLSWLLKIVNLEMHTWTMNCPLIFVYIASCGGTNVTELLTAVIKSQIWDSFGTLWQT